MLLEETTGTHSAGQSRASSDYCPKVMDGTSGALSNGASSVGLDQDVRPRPLIKCPLKGVLYGWQRKSEHLQQRTRSRTGVYLVVLGPVYMKKSCPG